MKDCASTMAEHQALIPQAFQLERELTLMPREFQERLSAKNRSQKSARSNTSSTRSHKMASSNNSRITKTNHRHSTEKSNLSNLYQEDPDLLNANTEYVTTSPTCGHNGNNTPVNNLDNELLSPELESTSTHIHLDQETKFMFDNAYANRESEGGFSVQTPPNNLHIRDLMIPLNEWGSQQQETIREKKYTVLPSISKSPGSENSSHHRIERSETFINNQLDFTRDKIEQEADFFADFRVNTSQVKPTPRQDPLPPIKHEDIIKIPSATMSRQNSINTKMKMRNEKQMYM